MGTRAPPKTRLRTRRNSHRAARKGNRTFRLSASSTKEFASHCTHPGGVSTRTSSLRRPNKASFTTFDGLGYYLFDKVTGNNLTSNLQDYRIPGIGDMPEIEVAFTEGGFEHVKGKGVGMSELATMPIAAAVANAVFDATGWRPL